MLRLRCGLAGLAFIAASSQANAQARYSDTRDTLRFREITRGATRLTAPMREFTATSEQAATIAVVRIGGDTARAWFEALTIAATGAAGEQRPATEAALRRPFTLLWDDRGYVRALSAPTFPESFRGIADLKHQFLDFFPRLPTGGLRVGLVWTDTLERTDSTADQSLYWRSIGSYRVERDTMVGASAALVIRMRQDLSMRTEGPVPGQPARAESELLGSEQGFFVFAPGSGRLLGRRREGRLEGNLTMRSDAGPMALRQAYRYTSALDAVMKGAVP